VALDTTRTRLHPPMLWRWMLSVLLAALVMVGLLGMHTLMTGHPEAPMTAVSSIGAEHGHGPSSDTGVVAETACADCAPGAAHDALMGACVLGLLAVVLWAARSGPGAGRARRRVWSGCCCRYCPVRRRCWTCPSVEREPTVPALVAGAESCPHAGEVHRSMEKDQWL